MKSISIAAAQGTLLIPVFSPDTLIGCSDRVAGAGCFGAALMLQPDLVASCAHAISDAVDTPVTIKCRLGMTYLL